MTVTRGPQERSRGSQGSGLPAPQTTIHFDPTKSDVELFDSLAEKQADAMPSGRDAINANQLRKYFGEIKDLYRQFKARTTTSSDEESKAIYENNFEARFKMLRSKVAYGQRANASAKLTREFTALVSEGVARVRPGNHKDFERFVMHLEAVIGFMYGKDKVSK